MVSLSTFLFLVGAASTFGRILKSSSLGDQEGMIPAHQRPARRTSTCSAAYREVTGSTMCLTDSYDYIRGTAGINAVDKALILKMHNDYRNGVSPKAKAMPKLYWSNELARVAEKWAKQCYGGHEENQGKSRFIPAYGMEPGQNAAWGYSNWAAAIKTWHDEVADFSYGYGSLNGGVIGHYTQIVQDATLLIGCGYAKCSNSYKHYYFCDYLKGQSNLKSPYASGSSCSGCGGKCTGKLCDCGGKFCYNGGSLDMSTCQCSCTPLYTGPTCSQKNCPASDAEGCGRWFRKHHCKQFYNVPEECPHMCNKC